MAGSRPSRPETWRRVLLLGADHIGDVLYRTVGLGELKAAFPQCEFLFAASFPAAALLENHPYVSLLKMDRASEHRGLLDQVRIIRRTSVDAVICYDTGASARHIASVALAGVPNCAGYVYKGFSGLVTHPAAIRYPQTFPGYFRDLVEGLTATTVATLRPHVNVTEAHRLRARELKKALGIGAKPMVVATVTSRQVSHPAIQRRMVESLAELRRRSDVAVVLSGAASDESALRKLADDAGLDCVYETGRLSLMEVIAFFELAAVAFCLDSGPRHMANAAGIPVVFCRNMQISKVETGAYLDTEIDIAPDVELISYAELQEPPLFSMETAVSALQRFLT
jgi:ADP-heptose:LPS heptosyltransferase